MLEWLVPVPNIVEEMKLVFRREQGGADGVYGRVAPSLVVEFPSTVEECEEDLVFRRTEEVEVRYFKV